jgi:hypothetical protein
MKRTVVLLNLAFCYFSASTAQTTYHSAVGLRIGTGCYDLFSASYQYHVPITALPGLQWFMGGGLLSLRRKA